MRRSSLARRQPFEVVGSESTQAIAEVAEAACAEFTGLLLPGRGPLASPTRLAQFTDGEMSAVAEEEAIGELKGGVGAHLE